MWELRRKLFATLNWWPEEYHNLIDGEVHHLPDIEYWDRALQLSAIKLSFKQIPMLRCFLWMQLSTCISTKGGLLLLRFWLHLELFWWVIKMTIINHKLFNLMIVLLDNCNIVRFKTAKPLLHGQRAGRRLVAVSYYFPHPFLQWNHTKVGKSPFFL